MKHLQSVIHLEKNLQFSSIKALLNLKPVSLFIFLDQVVRNRKRPSNNESYV